MKEVGAEGAGAPAAASPAAAAASATVADDKVTGFWIVLYGYLLSSSTDSNGPWVHPVLPTLLRSVDASVSERKARDPAGNMGEWGVAQLHLGHTLNHRGGRGTFLRWVIPPRAYPESGDTHHPIQSAKPMHVGREPFVSVVLSQAEMAAPAGQRSTQPMVLWRQASNHKLNFVFLAHLHV